MEVASFVFGAIPIALYALDNYQRCLKPAKNFWKYDIILEQIKMNIYLQQEQLNATMVGLGLHNPTTEQLRDHLRLVFTEEKCEKFINILERMGKLLEDMMKNLDIDTQGKPKWSDDTPERAEWEWKRVKQSFGDKKRKELIEELQYWNSGLKAIVEKVEIPLPDEDTNSLVRKIQARLGARQRDKIREELGFVYQALHKTGWTCRCSEHRAVIRLSWHNEKTSAGGNFGFDFAALRAPPPWHQISINLEDREVDRLMPPTPATSRSPSPSNRESKKRFPMFHIRLGRKKKQDSIDEAHAADTAQALHPPLSNPPLPQQISCMCAFINGARENKAGVIQIERSGSTGNHLVVKLLRESPTDTNSEARLLGSLLLNPGPRRQPGVFLLSRKQRLEIAAAVTWAALYLFGTPWFGSDWNGKDDVQVFLQTQGQQHHRAAVQVTHIGISYVFRPEASRDTTTPARDGFTFQTRQIRNRGLFTLGILLVELCLGKTFEQIHQEAQEDDLSSLPGRAGEISSTPAPPSVYDIATELIDTIFANEGDLYGNAVQRCLRCEFPGRDVTKDFSFQTFRKDFLDGVVAPIQATFESCL
ncbi:hypothetical protein B0H67DRAFT_646098 [Lasiosphaeris hirsuta]|uniref:DUF7580 domain-containing protein n=1 Tax=Lasiosphaeris hirsuta TaxID=260670 RepID=A0AA40DNZ4_9PEZI|nr:hypothetical protein B0H67DRAFT_646098 [Lasiosphaeris hirsuta]